MTSPNHSSVAPGLTPSVASPSLASEVCEPSSVRVSVPESILFWAFRYALGRMTYAVDDVAGALIVNAHRLSSRDRALILREITEAEQRGGLGMGCDIASWHSVQHALLAAEDGSQSPQQVTGKASEPQLGSRPDPKATP